MPIVRPKAVLSIDEYTELFKCVMHRKGEDIGKSFDLIFEKYNLNSNNDYLILNREVYKLKDYTKKQKFDKRRFNLVIEMTNMKKGRKNEKRKKRGS